MILYDPGKFPALLEHVKTKQLYPRNGGVPQEGNLQEHLDQFTEHVEEMVSKKFSGTFNYSCFSILQVMGVWEGL